LRQALTDARAPIEGGKTDPALAARLASLGAAVNASPATPAAARQAAALKQVLAGIAAKLR
jgi:hypothetical protein